MDEELQIYNSMRFQKAFVKAMAECEASMFTESGEGVAGEIRYANEIGVAMYGATIYVRVVPFLGAEKVAPPSLKTTGFNLKSCKPVTLELK